jgi:AAA+ ATPase superfamily predicted ATPase
MAGNPFRFGSSVLNKNFVNRDSEKTRLISNFRSTINTIIISPRRWGKTSLVKEAIRLTTDKNICFCFIDMFFIRSEEEFYTVFAREIIKATASKLDERIANIKEFFRQITPKIQLGVDAEHELSLSFDWEEIKSSREEILNLPEKIAIKKGIKIVVCIDEFQNIATFKDSEAVEKSLRSCWQHHQNTSYCLFGSKRHMLSEIFNKKSKPFYRFGDMILLQKIQKEAWIPFLLHKFKESGIIISEHQVMSIIDKAGNHPYYIQQLSSGVWNLSATEVTEEIIEIALQEMLDTNSIFYQKEIETLSNTQINLLIAIMSGAKQLTSVDVMTKYRLGTPRNVQQNREVLEKSDFIDVTPTNIELLDPVFLEWFKRNLV